MDPLPTGTVTMLFSDIEGSTALLSRLGDRYGEALSAQRSIVRAAIAAFGGHEMGTEGDSFFVVFESAQDAVRAGVRAQMGLAAHAWPDGGAVRVRMGLHTGEPTRLDEGYVGMDLNKAARIAATGHGGQIVMSDATRQLVAGALPDGQQLVDLGSHRLKDIEEPVHMFQVVVPGLPAQFPPLKSLGAQTSLPVPATALVGREGELAELRAGVQQPGVRLVTLTGPGGVGKTRLALALAASLDRTFPAGIFFVPLATVTSADVMWKVIADSIDADVERAPATAVKDQLAARQVLLVLDNLEQLHEAAGVVAALLEAAPRVVVIATSRRPLHLLGEFEFAVPPLAATDSLDAGVIAMSPAVSLFAQQAALVRRGFTVGPDNAADVAAICRRLDGLPLAIELAASRVKLLPPKALLARLKDRLDLAAPAVGRPDRQQTLRATIAWSYDLLNPELEGVFARMGAFVGGCDLDAVAAVACPPGLDPLEAVGELLDGSLITVTEMADGEPRVDMLETIREYAVDRLAQSGEQDEARRRHAEYYAHFAEQANEQLHGPRQLTWLDRLEIEHDNLRAALAWSLDAAPVTGDEARQRSALGLRLVNALSWFWYGHSHAADGRRWLEMAIDRATEEEGPHLAAAVHGLAVLLLHEGEYERGRAALQQNLAVWRRLGDTAGLAKGLNSLGVAHRMLGEYDLARRELGESIDVARSAGHSARLSTALTNMATVEVDCGLPDRAIPILQEAIALDRKLGDPWAVAVGQNNLAGALISAGHAAEGHRLLDSIADEVVALGDVDLLASVVELFSIALAEQGADTDAARLSGAAEALRESGGVPIGEPDEAMLERSLGPARTRIGHDVWQREHAAGRELHAAQAIDLGRRPLAPPVR